MFNVFADINWLAVALATAASTGLGALWFLLLFPKQYAVALGRENAPERKPTALANFGPLVCTFGTTITTAVLISALHVDDLPTGLLFGAIVGLGYLGSMTFNIAINPNFPRPLHYGLVCAPFFLVGSLMTSTILVVMG